MSCATRILFTLNRFKRHQRFSSYYTVYHNEKRGIFYVKLDKNSRAVLQYKEEGRDMQAINVPYRYTGQGFTYATVYHYYMFLSCDYMQKYYLATKNSDIEELIVGLLNILEGPDSEPLVSEDF